MLTQMYAVTLVWLNNIENMQIIIQQANFHV